MKVYFDRKVLLGFFLALSILTVLGIYTYKNSQDSISTSRMVSHTNEILYRIEKLHSLNLEMIQQFEGIGVGLHRIVSRRGVKSGRKQMLIMGNLFFFIPTQN